MIEFAVRVLEQKGIAHQLRFPHNRLQLRSALIDWMVRQPVIADGQSHARRAIVRIGKIAEHEEIVGRTGHEHSLEERKVGRHAHLPDHDFEKVQLITTTSGFQPSGIGDGRVSSISDSDRLATL